MQNFLSLHWVLLVALLAAAHTAVAHPVRTSKWVKTQQYRDTESGGVWKVFEKTKKSSVESIKPQAHLINENGDELIKHGSSGWLYKKKTVEKSIISILVPDAPQAHLRPNASHHFDIKNEAGTSVKESANEDLLGHAKTEPDCTQGHLLPSHQEPLPFIDSAAGALPHIVLPGAFTTVMIMMALVWLAILTLGLVEFGGYICKRNKATRLSDSTEEYLIKLRADGCKDVEKVPWQIITVPRAQEEAKSRLSSENLLSNNFELDSESASGLDDYRIV